MIVCCEREVRDSCLKSYWVIYFSKMLWDHIQDANCLGVKGGSCSVDTAPGGHVMATVFYGFKRPIGGGVMLIMLFKIL